MLVIHGGVCFPATGPKGAETDRNVAEGLTDASRLLCWFAKPIEFGGRKPWSHLSGRNGIVVGPLVSSIIDGTNCLVSVSPAHLLILKLDIAPKNHDCGRDVLAKWLIWGDESLGNFQPEEGNLEMVDLFCDQAGNLRPVCSSLTCQRRAAAVTSTAWGAMTAGPTSWPRISWKPCGP
jgi:hypothetical protein